MASSSRYFDIGILGTRQWIWQVNVTQVGNELVRQMPSRGCEKQIYFKKKACLPCVKLEHLG